MESAMRRLLHASGFVSRTVPACSLRLHLSGYQIAALNRGAVRRYDAFDVNRHLHGGARRPLLRRRPENGDAEPAGPVQRVPVLRYRQRRAVEVVPPLQGAARPALRGRTRAAPRRAWLPPSPGDLSPHPGPPPVVPALRGHFPLCPTQSGGLRAGQTPYLILDDTHPRKRGKKMQKVPRASSAVEAVNSIRCL